MDLDSVVILAEDSTFGAPQVSRSFFAFVVVGSGAMGTDGNPGPRRSQMGPLSVQEITEPG